MTYENLKDKVSDYIRDNDWIDNHPNEILRAANNALEQINAGQYQTEIRSDASQIGYDFQREIQDVLFTDEVTGTITTAGTTTLIDSSATFTTTEDVAVGDFITNTTDISVARVVSIDSATQITTSTLRNGTNNTWTVDDEYTIEGKGYTISSGWNYKFPLNLRLAEDRDRYFEFVNEEMFKRRQGVGRSSQLMYTIEWNGNTQIIKINYDTDEALYFDFITKNIVKDSSGTRKMVLAADSDELLIPDTFSLCPVELTASDCLGQIHGYTSNECVRFLTTGRQKMKNMIDSIGIKENKPRKQLKVRGEWSSNRRIIRND
jgi:hypothetical protein